jgi:hypothetical protein
MLTVGSARADFVTSQVSTTLENEIHDSSLETASTSTIGVGSVISGVLLYTQIGQTGNLHSIPGSFSGEVTAVFSLLVTNVVSGVPGVGNVLTFAPNPSFEAVYGTGAMAALFENDGGTPLTAQFAAGGGAVGTYFTDAQAGTLQAVAGFTGAGGTAAGAEAWTGTATNLSFPPTSGLSGEYNGNIDLLPPPGGGAYAPGTLGSLNIAFNEPNPNLPAGNNTQLFIHGDQKFNANFPGSSPFGVADDSSLFFFVNATATAPEPSSCVLLSMGGAMLLFFRKRRNKVVA